MRSAIDQHFRRMKKLDRINRMTFEALREMRDNDAALHFTPNAGWALSNGQWLLDEVARAIIRNPHIITVDHPLFRNAYAQTWRWTDLPEEKNNVD